MVIWGLSYGGGGWDEQAGPPYKRIHCLKSVFLKRWNISSNISPNDHCLGMVVNTLCKSASKMVFPQPGSLPTCSVCCVPCWQWLLVFHRKLWWLRKFVAQEVATKCLGCWPEASVCSKVSSGSAEACLLTKASCSDTPHCNCKHASRQF